MNGLMQCNTSFPDHEQQRALNTLRYIHANPKTAAAFTTDPKCPDVLGR